MRSEKLFYSLLALSLLLILLCGPVLADSETHQPTLIIPTKYRYLLADMVQVPEGGSAPVPAPAPAPSHVQSSASAGNAPAPVQDEDPGMDEEALLAALAPGQSSSGYGRGFVQTNFDVSFEEPGRRIDNHERLTARGLFNVHVSHELN